MYRWVMNESSCVLIQTLSHILHDEKKLLEVDLLLTGFVDSVYSLKQPRLNGKWKIYKSICLIYLQYHFYSNACSGLQT